MSFPDRISSPCSLPPGSRSPRILLLLNGLIILGLFVFARSRFGRWSTAFRDSLVAAEACGVPTKRLRLGVFVAAAAIAAPAGVIYAQYALQANTDLFLQSTTLFEVIVVALVGGAARPWGALVGALIMTQLSYHVANAFPGRDGLSALIFGIAFLFVALAMPEGISGFWAKITAHVRSSKPDAGMLPAQSEA